MATTGRGSGDVQEHEHQHRRRHHRHHRRRHGRHRHHRRHDHHAHHHHHHHHRHDNVAHVNLSEVHASNVAGIEIYADAVCAKYGDSVACGTGLVCDNPHARIAEPIDCSPKGEKHHLHALLAALKFAEGVRSREVTVYMSHAPTAHYFNYWLHRWVVRDFRRKGRHTPRLPGYDLWQRIFESRQALMDRAVDLNVDHLKRKTSEKMREAYALAQLGTRMHVVCPLCQRSHARQFNTHRCEPICNYDQCRDKRFRNVPEYQAHLETWHQRDCPSPECEDGLGIYSDKELRRHLREVHDKKYGCDFCGRLFDCPVRYRDHLKKCPQAERCRDCGLRFTTRRQANIHREKAAHGEFDDESEYDSDDSSRTSSSSTTTSSLSSDYDFLTFTTSRRR